MEITYLGHSCFRIKEKKVTVVTDPFLPSMVGFPLPKISADIVTVSHQHPDHNNVSFVEGEPFVISDPGEYEVKGISVFGYPTYHDSKSGSIRGTNTIYLIESEDLRICHLGDLGGTIPAKIIEELGEIDMLMVPVGGVYTLGPKEAVELIGQLEPKIVLPMHFKEAGINEENFGKLATVEDFVREFGKEPERQERLTVNKGNLPQETKLVILSRKS